MSSIIDKIRALRALAQSSNVNEAANAARMADRLLQQHQIAEAELTDAAPEESPFEAEHAYGVWGERVPAWEASLSSSLAKHYNCRSIFIVMHDGRQQAKIVGRPSDVETVRFQWAFFRAEIIRLCEVHGKGKGRSWRVSFCRGAARAITEAMSDEKRASRTHASSSALVVLDNRGIEVDRAFAKLYPNSVKRGASPVGNIDGFEFGKRAGGSLNGRSQIGVSGTRLLK